MHLGIQIAPTALVIISRIESQLSMFWWNCQMFDEVKIDQLHFSRMHVQYPKLVAPRSPRRALDV